jgi:hypothetical protein
LNLVDGIGTLTLLPLFKERIPVDTRQAVLCAVVKESEKRMSEWNTLTNRLTYLGRTAEKRKENWVEFNDILIALTCATTDTKIER